MGTVISSQGVVVHGHGPRDRRELEVPRELALERLAVCSPWPFGVDCFLRRAG